MPAIHSEPIVISTVDHDHIERLIAAHGRRRDRPGLAALSEELERARVVEPNDVPKDVVRLGSRVQFVDESTGDREDVIPVLPADADAARGRVSILAPIAGALIGLRVGQAIDWPFPSGVRHLRVVGVEPSGDD
jgi:regulator of nucleoside diphosphate kinase